MDEGLVRPTTARLGVRIRVRHPAPPHHHHHDRFRSPPPPSIHRHHYPTLVITLASTASPPPSLLEATTIHHRQATAKAKTARIPAGDDDKEEIARLGDPSLTTVGEHGHNE
ncbi:hypothetical protein CPC08DRAFT_715918, partial [Agrocybe pediades]